ncbi:MAG: hypothetical protein ACXAAI_13115 [Promethearchaeota archaeon]
MRTKIEFNRQGNFIITILAIYFLFFGYISLVYEENVGDRLLFLYQVFFVPESYLSLIILMGIVFIMVFREQFFEYGIRNSFYILIIIILISWLWYWFISDFSFLFLTWYFIRIETYITFACLFCAIFLSAILGATAKEKYKRYKEKIQKIEV